MSGDDDDDEQMAYDRTMQSWLDSTLASWSTETWQWFDGLNDGLVRSKGGGSTVSDILLTRQAHLRANSRGSFVGLHAQLDDLCVKLLSAAMMRATIGWMLLAFERLSTSTKGSLDQYDPLTRVTVWTAVDAMLGYPLLSAATIPKDSNTRYNPSRRMLILRNSIRTETEEKSTACCNCGAHVTPYPRSWIPFDDALRMVWCRCCYSPRLINEHRLCKLYEVTPEQLDRYQYLSIAGKKRAFSRQYLVSQVLADIDNATLAEIAQKPITHIHDILGSPSRSTKRNASTMRSSDTEQDRDEHANKRVAASCDEQPHNSEASSHDAESCPPLLRRPSDHDGSATAPSDKGTEFVCGTRSFVVHFKRTPTY